MTDITLLDKDFLLAISEQKDREVFAKIAALDIDENPVQTIEGKVTGGSINIDGQSAVRRTCSVTMISENMNLKEYYWGIRTKFRLEIGLKNKLIGKYAASDVYPDIVWFPQGTFVISGFNISLSTNNCTINISGKDKMCLLNGELGGQLFASIDFGTEEVETKKMVEVIPQGKILTSKDLEYFKYYRELNETDELKEEYSARKYDFVFVKNKQGQYKKDGNLYKKISESENESINVDSRYQIYKRIELPDEYFCETEENGNFYKEKENYYVLATGNETNTFNLIKFYDLQYEYNKYQIPVSKIIREAVHTYAKEPYHNIIINDLEDYGLEQLTYRGDKPLYLLRDKDTNDFTQIIGPSHIDYGTLNKLSNDKFDKLTELTNTENTYLFNDKYKVAKLEYGEDIGYRLTDLVYPGELISNIGDTLTSILDKIKTMLSDFEYFYDIDGRFIFQRKQIYINTSWSQLTDTGDSDMYVDPFKSKYVFSFEGNKLISSLQNSPQLASVRNDFTVWGKRTTAAGAEIPIHARYAIDKKPAQYTNLAGVTYTTEQGKENSKVVDWREIIYQMALDYFAGQGCSSSNPIYTSDGELTDPDQFLYEVGRRNPDTYPTGYTGYEQYYTDLEGFWRELYNPDYEAPESHTGGYYKTTMVSSDNSQYFSYQTTWQEAESITGESLYDENTGWNKTVFEAPETLNFWFDFLDSDQELGQFSISAIGDRSKVVNEDKASAIIFKEVPGLILYSSNEDKERLTTQITDLRRTIMKNSGYVFIYLPKGYSQYFTTSYRSTSVKNKIDDLIYQFSYCAESISITSIPIYYLEPNTRIYVRDEKTNIEGEYLVNRITIPLTYNGTMSISAGKAAERLY